MIVQSAAASAAQDEARMQREQDLAFRREQLGLDRERLAQQGRESDARVENVKTETKARQFDLKRAEIDDATKMMDRELYFAKFGQYPQDYQMDVDRQNQELTTRANVAKVTAAEEEVDPNSPKNLRLARRDDAAIAASDSELALNKAKLDEFNATAAMRRDMERAELEGKQALASKSKLEFANAKVESRFARLGMLTPLQRTHLNEGFKDQIRKTYLDAVARGVTDPVTGVTDFKALEERIASVDAVVDVATRFQMLRGMDPNKATQAQAMFKALGQDLAISSPDAYAAGKTMVKAMNNVLDIMVPPETMAKRDKVAPPPTPKPPGEISVRMKPKDDKKETARKLKVDSNRNVIAKYLAENTDELRQLREIVAKRVGGKDLATDERIIDYVKSRFSPEGGMDPGGFGLSEAIPNMIAFENQRK